jgi:hypothetical protein
MSSTRWRGLASGILAVLTCLCLLVSILALWAGRTVLDTDRFTAAVDTSLSHPAVQDALSEWVSAQVEEVITESDVAAQIVPDDVAILSPLLERVLIRFATEEVDQVVRSQRVHDLVVEGVRRAHTVVLRVIEGERPEGGFVVVDDGKVNLNLLPVIGLALDRAEQLEVLSGRDLPDLTRDMSVEAQNEALGEALGTDLRDDFGQLTIYERDAASDTSIVGAAQQALSLFRWAQALLVVATLMLGALTVAVANDRRRMGAWLAFGAFAVALLVRVVVRRVSDAAPEVIVDADARSAARVVIDNVVGNLDRTVTILALLALVLLAVLIGMGWLGQRPEQRVRLETWVAAHADLVRGAAVVLAVLVLLVLGLSTWTFLLAAAVGVGLWSLPLVAGDRHATEESSAGSTPESSE